MQRQGRVARQVSYLSGHKAIYQMSLTCDKLSF